jgi:GTP-binding protein
VFVDRVRIQVRGGDGGAGVASFQRQKARPRGKPNGGSGGRGGDAFVVADADVATLLAYARQPHWSAESGTHGEGDLRHGKVGADLEIRVPLGTLVRDDDGTLLADLVEHGQKIRVVEGGKGGRGNAGFVSPKRRAPSFAEQGEYGRPVWITLELKLIADAALIGYPNAGKSTLISRVSAAKPKIASYPFTTLEPNLGVVEVGDRQFIMADIPGLVGGAAEGKGLGHEFLRHTERARVLVVLIDPSSLQHDAAPTQLEVLTRELAAHSPELAARPRIVAVNKIDAVDNPDDVRSWAESESSHVVSAVTGEGLDGLLHAVADAVDAAERATPDREGFVLHRPLPPSFSVRRLGDEWVVEGRAAERAVNLADLTVPEAADFAASRLRRLGVDEALAAAGAQPGDDVRIGTIVFTYDPDLGEDEIEGEEVVEVSE